MVIETLQSLGRWEEASQKLVVLIENNPDWWSCIKQYIYCQIQLCVDLYKDKDKVKDLPRSTDNPITCTNGHTKDDGHDGVSRESTGVSGTTKEGVTSAEDSDLGGSGESTQNKQAGTVESERNPVDDSATNSEKDSSKLGTTDVQATPTSSSDTWLRPLIEAQDLINRLAEVELMKFRTKESGDIEFRGPLLARLELVKQANQLKEIDAHIPIGE